jgi:nitrite reductase/ring-hydroxylating ferredoxin subunit
VSNSGAADPAAEVRLVPLGEAAGRTRWIVTDHDQSFAVFADDPAHLRVVDARCPHRGGPLIEGVLRNGAVVCPWHWYTFDLDTGRCRNVRDHELRSYRVIHRDGAAYAEVPPAPRHLSWAERLRAHARGDA